MQLRWQSNPFFSWNFLAKWKKSFVDYFFLHHNIMKPYKTHFACPLNISNLSPWQFIPWDAHRLLYHPEQEIQPNNPRAARSGHPVYLISNLGRGVFDNSCPVFKSGYFVIKISGEFLKCPFLVDPANSTRARTESSHLPTFDAHNFVTVESKYPANPLWQKVSAN